MFVLVLIGLYCLKALRVIINFISFPESNLVLNSIFNFSVLSKHVPFRHVRPGVELIYYSHSSGISFALFLCIQCAALCLKPLLHFRTKVVLLSRVLCPMSTRRWRLWGGLALTRLSYIDLGSSLGKFRFCFSTHTSYGIFDLVFYGFLSTINNYKLLNKTYF